MRLGGVMSRPAKCCTRAIASAAITLLLSLVLLPGPAQAVVIEVNTIGPAAPGVWTQGPLAGGGTNAIVDLTGLGGNLENSAPLPTGAANLTTGFSNADRAELAVGDNFGLVSNVFTNGLSLGYSYHKATVAGGNAFAAPALKLAFSKGGTCTSGDCFVQLVYEPTWNQPANPGASLVVPTDVWTNIVISLTDGLFWGTGGFGEPNTAGGPPLRTLADWLTAFDADFPLASLVGLSVGVGTFNQGQNGYFDNVSIVYDGFGERIYDFEVAATVPEPGTVMSFAVGLIGLLWLTRRRQTLAA